MTIRLCDNNSGAAEAARRLRQLLPECEVLRQRCLRHCSLCQSSYFALVDDLPLRGRSIDDLCRQVVAAVVAAAG